MSNHAQERHPHGKAAFLRERGELSYLDVHESLKKETRAVRRYSRFFTYI